VEVLVSVPCVIYEDDHLLVVNKPPGLNTHAPSPYAGEGIYDWLRHREPRWARLAIMHRLDKETSGVLVFSKTDLANRSLTEQFTRHTARKKYLLLTDRPMRQKELTVRTALIRLGDKHIARPAHTGGELAETRFRALGCAPGGTLVEAEPVTGRTHQIRVHAKANGFPILGDTLYGGTPAARVHLHAQELSLKHPATGMALNFIAPVDFSTDSRMALRSAVIESFQTNAYRLVHGAADGWPGWHVDRAGDFLLSQSEQPLSGEQREALGRWLRVFSLRGAYHKTLTRQIRKTNAKQASPQKVLGETAPDPFAVSENGIQFGLSFDEGYSVGLFLDQRDNRRRFLTGHVASGFPLRWDADLNPLPTAPQEGSRHSDARERSPASQESKTAKAAAQSCSPPSRGATAPLRRDGGWERPGVGSSPPLAGMQLLNAFAYTCGFSVCAAKAGARTTSLDLSRKYLEWGKSNFAMNGLNASAHDFIDGDVFDWLRRLAKKRQQFDVIALDPPTFSQSKEHGVFQAEKDFGELVTSALPLLKGKGVLFVSTNAAKLAPNDFLAQITTAIGSARRRILRQHYVPQPPDFPITRAEPAYLKTLWLRVE